MRRILDKSGAEWRAEEQSRYGMGRKHQGDPLPEPSAAVIVFSGPEGRTLTADLPPGRLETIAEDDLAKVLDEALSREERKRRR
jgi:hypothetical protein